MSANEEAIVAGAKAMDAYWGGRYAPDEVEELRGEITAILEAVTPILLSHEREQTRLAHLDAMVNRETSQAELAEAWDEGNRIGYQDRGREAQGRKLRPNPYRSAE